MRIICVLVAGLMLAAAANANLLENPGFETGLAPWVGGGVYEHGVYGAPGNETLGDWFNAEAMGVLDRKIQQTTTAVFMDGVTYDFWGWAIGGGNRTGIARFQIGWDDGNGFIPLASAHYDVTGVDAWQELDGVSYTVDGGAEIGANIIVRMADVNDLVPPEDVNLYDIWFDGAVLTPEPASLLLLGLGALALRRR
ncbi:MAG: PEP-CTERM sorting domain-containing protein [Phycisphaerae bacterium]|jgi:hypothetical protein